MRGCKPSIKPLPQARQGRLAAPAPATFAAGLVTALAGRRLHRPRSAPPVGFGGFPIPGFAPHGYAGAPLGGGAPINANVARPGEPTTKQILFAASLAKQLNVGLPAEALQDKRAMSEFIDQSQSFNVFVQEPNYGKLSSMHFYGWKKGLKTGMYYLRTKAASDAIKFTVDQQSLQRKSQADAKNEGMSQLSTSIENTGECLSCGA